MERIEVPVVGWIAFGALVLCLLVIDLLAHRKKHGESKRSAIAWSIVWILFGLGFGLFVWREYGPRPGQEYLGAWLIEKSLSLDNLFVFLVIFRSLNVPDEEQRRVLFWGILGAVVFRALFIFAGVEVLERWHPVVYLFGAILLFTAIRVAREDPSRKHESRLVHWLAQRLPVTTEVDGKHFVVRRTGRLVATPLLVALMAIELTDIAFAVDSVPAALSVSHEPFIVYTSNIFAILGLRALYIALAHVVTELRYLHYGLSAILAFAGMKMIVPDTWLHVPPLVSVAIILGCLGTSVAASLRSRALERRRDRGPGGPGGTPSARPREVPT